MKSACEPAVCACSRNGQWHPMFHQKRSGQQGEGGDCPPQLSPCEDPAGILSPSLGPPTQERFGAFGVGADEGHEDDPRTGAPLL